MDENATEKVIRRLGGYAQFARLLERTTGVPEYRQDAFAWSRRNWFPPNKLRAILLLCRADRLPIDHPQLIVERANTRRIA